jgi:hypothetical protein
MRRLVPVAAAAAALVITGCGERSSGTSGTSPPSGAPDEVVVRVVTEGGFAAESREPAQLPEVSVFGDGRVITQGPSTLEYPGPALPNLQEFRLTRDGLAAVVDEARSAGLLDKPLPDYGDAGITDQATTTVTLRLDGTNAEVQVYALNFDDGLTVEQRENRRQLQQFIGFVGHAHGVGVHVMPRSTRRYEPETLAVRVKRSCPTSRPRSASGRSPTSPAPNARCSAAPSSRRYSTRPTARAKTRDGSPARTATDSSSARSCPTSAAVTTSQERQVNFLTGENGTGLRERVELHGEVLGQRVDVA